MGLFGRDTQTQKPLTMQAQRDASPAPVPGSTTTIAEGTRISGEIKGSTDLRIEGEFKGSVTISGIVFVSGTGKVRASIHGATVTIAGRVDGDVFGDQIVELEPTAVVNGNLLAPKILIREGASLQGRVEMASPTPETSTLKDAPGKKKNRKGHAQKQTQSTQPAENAGDDIEGDQPAEPDQKSD